MINKKLYFSIIFLFSFLCFNAQGQLEDELTYNQIEQKIDNSHKDSLELWKSINMYISKAKKNRNQEALVYAYRYASIFSKEPKSLKYADSAIIISQGSNNKKLIANAFLNRGNIFMSISQYQKSLDDILEANKYAKEIPNDNQYIFYKSKYYIAQNKMYLGLYDEANEELKECILFFKKNLNDESLGKDYEMYYIYSLISIIDTNTKIGKIADNKTLLEESFNYINTHKLSQYKPYFISLEGTDDFYNKQYNDAINKLTLALKT